MRKAFQSQLSTLFISRLRKVTLEIYQNILSKNTLTLKMFFFLEEKRNDPSSYLGVILVRR